MSTPEGKVKELVKTLLRRYKVYPAKDAGAFPSDALGWYYMPVQQMSVKGIPDFLGHFFGVFWAIEAKAPGKEPTGFQELQLKAIGTSGGARFVVDGPESLGVFEDWLIKIIEEECDEC